MIIQLILVAALLGFLVMTWKRAQQGALSRAAAAAWSLLWIAAGVVVLRPEVANFISNLVGVGRGADAVVYVSIVALFYLAFRVFLRLEKMNRELTALVRKIALMEEKKRD